ncbi:1-deoxy-D-xylulose 5-phosphate reductoisomerase [Lacunisphaera limnophila]|uniref:1-deoxy-D-xylulose 5-phosphate reductoisomerase n=1 Tax=Lacunisphaera limnophila TaxID=1838286 RepID=A0A1D8B008_9BACT|nr:1-deoxy-D-xylulose-5-phosphate reductoisomerase [Lacunisphaera limnophila]AOS46476.1 1-deoxy-D-xylulose 5-phosphate reductoisomerase [Lacunisphaera limnophila]
MATPGPKKRIVLLGATGSIGESTLRVIAAHRDRLELVGIAAQRNHGRLVEIARQFGVRHVGLHDPAALAAARSDAAFPAGTQFHGGLEGLSALATLPEADTILIAVVGTAGLQPALAAIAARKTIALASKEILVMAGKFVMAAAQASGARLLPVDSEHNAVFQCLEGRRPDEVRRIVLTASGGAFRDWPQEKLATATVADALKHPNWAMGPKITVDSATLANKGLELIEAQWLFGLQPAQCQAVLHTQSIVHCLAEFTDGSMLAQLCPPSMTFPIQHALLWPDRAPASTESALPLEKIFSLDFRPVDETRYPCLRLAREAMHAGGTAPAIFNAANEVAVAAFLAGRVPFLAIPRIVEHTLSRLPAVEPNSLAAVLNVDQEARVTATAHLSGVL